MLLYALLYLTGYPDMTIDEIKRFRQLGTQDARAIRNTAMRRASRRPTGPLGQGIATAVGMAIAERCCGALSATPSSTTAPMSSRATAA